MPIPPVRLEPEVGGHAAPALLFVPSGDGPLPLVLLGHGAHLSKDDEVMQILARGIARGTPAGVALMDFLVTSSPNGCPRQVHWSCFGGHTHRALHSRKACFTRRSSPLW